MVSASGPRSSVLDNSGNLHAAEAVPQRGRARILQAAMPSASLLGNSRELLPSEVGQKHARNSGKKR